jgi:hypothetical protein
MSFRIRGLDPALFADCLAASDATLERQAIVRTHAEEEYSAPCRVTLEDAAIGEPLLLLNYEHQPAHTPYQQAGPIFVREGTHAPFDGVDVIPPALARRTLSLRAFDASGMMIDADLCEGKDAADLIARLFAHADAVCVHAHYARRGCFAARIERA